MDENTHLLNSDNCIMASSTNSSSTVESSPEARVVLVSRPKYQKWILLSLFCSLAFLQSAVFVAWMPIANSVLKAFGPEWTSSTMSWQINFATIANPFIQWPVWKAIHKFDLSRSLRWGGAFPLFLATGIQCTSSVVPISNDVFKWLSFGSFFLVGLVGVVFFSSITRFSSLWFPPDQRTTATGLSCTFANLGALLPSIAGPLMVTDPNVKSDQIGQNSGPYLQIDPQILQSEIRHYLFTYFCLASVLFLVFFVYFPSERDLIIDPEDSGEILTVRKSLEQLIRIPSVLCVMLVYSLNCLTHVWGSTLLTLTLAPLRISQASIGIMTIASILATAVLTVIISRVADIYFRSDLKKLLMMLLPVHAISIIIFGVSILTADKNVNNEVLISVLYVVCLSSLNTCTPLLFELGCELGHPVSEEIVAGSFDQMVNVFSICFHFLFTLIANTSNDFSVILYLLMCLPCFSLAIFSLVSEDYKRSKAETQQTTQ